MSQEIVEYYSKAMLFHSLVVTFCAIRSPTEVATILTYFCIILRIFMVMGWYCQKRKVIFVGAAAIEAFVNVILFFITAVKSN